MTKNQDVKCLVCDEVIEKDEALRFVKGPDGNVWFDPSGKAVGEDVYIKANQGLVKKALTAEMFEKALDAKASPEILEQIESLLLKQLHQAIGLARKGAFVTSGVDKTDAAFYKGNVTLALMPTDVGGDAKKRLKFLRTQGLKLVEVSTKDALSQAIGVANTSVIGIKKGRATFGLLKTLEKYCAFVGIKGAEKRKKFKDGRK